MAGRFSELADVVAGAGVARAGGVLFDLGVSSMQLDTAERGFGYREDGPLDMRMGPEGPTAADVVNTYPTKSGSPGSSSSYGEERYSRRIAAAIVRARGRTPIESHGRAGGDRGRGRPPATRRRRIPPAGRSRRCASRSTQSSRSSPPPFLGRSRLLEPGGRLVVISYHSLEDRIVKRFVLGEARLTPITRKPVGASEEEVTANPRARSAKLRAAERRARVRTEVAA